MKTPMLLLTVMLLSSSSLLAAETPESLLVSSIYADSSVLAPVAWYQTDHGDGTKWRAGISGWTIDGEWSRRRSATTSLLFAADLTPMNAHNSDRNYEYGERTEELDYEHASYRLRGGLRFEPNATSRVDVLLVALQEAVDGLPEDVMRRWANPYVGAEIAYTFAHIRDSQPLIASIDGMEVTVRADAFTGEEAWARITVAQHWGNTIGRFHMRQSAGAVAGADLDVVNDFRLGGSWDSLGGNAIYGLRQGELRAEHAAFATFGTDVQLAENWWAGPRVSSVISHELLIGYGLNLRGSWRTFGFNGGVAWAQSLDSDRRSSEPQLYAALIVPLYRR